jgi:hypothetical protein
MELELGLRLAHGMPHDHALAPRDAAAAGGAAWSMIASAARRARQILDTRRDKTYRATRARLPRQASQRGQRSPLSLSHTHSRHTHSTVHTRAPERVTLTGEREGRAAPPN